MAVFLAKETCPKCKNPSQTIGNGLSYCNSCQVAKFEKTSEYDFYAFNGPLFKLSESVDIIIVDGVKTVLSDYSLASVFVSDNADSYPEGFSVYFAFQPTDHVVFSPNDISSSWASNFINYFGGLPEDDARTALEYFLCCRQDNLAEWRDNYVCDYRGNVDDAINAYGEYLRESGLYASCGVPEDHINWYQIAKDRWFDGAVFFTGSHVFSTH